MAGLVAFVIGDAITDAYQEVDVTRIAPDAPAPVWTAAGALRLIPGGALNVARQFRHIAEVAYFSGYGGNDHSACASGRLRFLSRFGRAAVKTRFHSKGHVLARLDNPGSEVTEATRARHSVAAIEAVERKLSELEVRGGYCANGSATVAVLSDYRQGFWSAPVAGLAAALMRGYGVPFVVDAKPGGLPLEEVRGAACVKLNEAEAKALVGNPSAASWEAGDAVSSRYGVPVVVTRGAFAPVLCGPKWNGHATAGDYVSEDRPLWASGAGDCFTAYLAAGIAKDGGLTASCAKCAHEAGAVYVRNSYNAPVHPREIAERFGYAGAKVYKTGRELSDRLAVLGPGTEIGYTNGVFDLLHAGHVASLEFARSKCDFLVVFVNSDASAQAAKGKRPYMTTGERVAALAALSCVGAVVAFDEAEPSAAFASVGRCNVLVKGAEYAGREVKGKEFADKIVLAPEAVKVHTSDIVNRVLSRLSFT